MFSLISNDVLSTQVFRYQQSVLIGLCKSGKPEESAVSASAPGVPGQDVEAYLHEIITQT